MAKKDKMATVKKVRTTEKRDRMVMARKARTMGTRRRQRSNTEHCGRLRAHTYANK